MKNVVALFFSEQKYRACRAWSSWKKRLQLYPDAKRALLTAYADTDAAIRAINSVQIDHYLHEAMGPAQPASLWSGR